MTQDYKQQIEALLFASGRFMDVQTLLTLTGASGKQVLINNVRKLKEDYDKRNSPMMVVEEKDGWKLTVRETYLPLVRKIVSETELPISVLETLAIIAWKSPVLQSEVVSIRHNKAYEHISELTELGFLRKEAEGRSYRLNLTEKFFEYFDVDGTKDIREVFKKVVETPIQRKVDEFEEITQDMPEWYHQGAKFLKKEELPVWYMQGAKFLQEIDENQLNEDEFSEL